MNKTVTIEVPVKYAGAFELVLNELKKAEIKHPSFYTYPADQLSILMEEVGEVAKDINDEKDYSTEVAQVGAVVLRMLCQS